MEKILQGVGRFQREVFPSQAPLFEKLIDRQSPEYLFITCADSRVVQNLITNTEPGDLFVCRNVGNMVPSYGEASGGVTATIEYAVAVLNVKHIIVCGHSDCGAMKGVLHPEKVAHLPGVRNWLGYGDVARHIVKENYPDLPDEDILPVLTQQNVVAQLTNLRTHPCVAARVANGSLSLHGWVYHIHSGHVDAWDSGLRRFVSIDEYAATRTGSWSLMLAGD
jgi:carbonic anhydrase